MCSDANLDDAELLIQECNILYLGKASVGKTVHTQTLIDPSFMTRRTSAPSKESDYKSFVLINEENKKEFSLNIIDTPGLLYSGCDEDSLLQQCWKLLEKSIRHLNAIVLVYRFDAITEEDIHMIHIVRTFFGSQFRKNTVVVFTCVEKFAHKPDFLKKQLESLNPHIKESLIEFCQERILFVGTVNEDEFKKMTSESATQLQSNVNNMRNQFFDKILSLPPTPLPDELILKYDSKIGDMVSCLVRSYDPGTQMRIQSNIHSQLIEKKKMSKASQTSKFYKERQKDEKDIVSWNIQDEVNELQNPLPKLGYTVHKAIQRNILLVGASGSGKTTFIKVMQDPFFTVRQRVHYAVTRFAKCYPLHLVEDNQHLIINFIDTPGFGYITSEKINDENTRFQGRLDIVSAIQTCFKSLTEIHALFYFHQILEEKNWSKYDDIYFTEYQNAFPEIMKKCAWLIISKCEGPDTDLKDIINSFQKISKVKELDSRIALTGAIDVDTMENYKTEIQSEYKESVVKLRKNLFQIIYDLSSAHPLPASIQDFQKDISQIAGVLKQDLENEKKKKQQEERNQRLFPNTGTKVKLVSNQGKYVYLNDDYLALGEKNSACEFLLENKGNSEITLKCNGKIVHRSGVSGWVALWSGNKPLPLKINPEPSSDFFTLFSLEDNINIGYSSDNKFLQIDKGKASIKFKWVF